MVFVLHSLNTREEKMKIIEGKGTAVLSVTKTILSGSIRIYNTATMAFQDKGRIIGIILLCICGALALSFTNTVAFLIEFIRDYVSSDHDIKEVTRIDITHYFAYFVMFLGALGLLLTLKLDKKIKELAVSYIDFSKVRFFFLEDEVSSNKKLSTYLFWVGSLTGLFMIIFFALIGRPKQEGLLEIFEETILLAASLIMFFAGLKAPRKISVRLFLIALVLFLMYGEEISWGQRLLKFGSPEFFTENNYQGEMNLHNFFNPIYDLVYKTFGLTFFVVLVLLWFFKKEQKNSLVNLFLPPRSLSFLIFMAVCSTFGNREFFETLFYFFIFLYSLRMLYCVKNPALNGKSTE